MGCATSLTFATTTTVYRVSVMAKTTLMPAAAAAQVLAVIGNGERPGGGGCNPSLASVSARSSVPAARARWNATRSFADTYAPSAGVPRAGRLRQFVVRSGREAGANCRRLLSPAVVARRAPARRDRQKTRVCTER